MHSTGAGHAVWHALAGGAPCWALLQARVWQQRIRAGRATATAVQLKAAVCGSVGQKQLAAVLSRSTCFSRASPNSSM